MRKLLILFAIIYFALPGYSQYTRHIVQLTDKKGTTYSLNSPSAFLSARAINRRTKQQIPVDSTDLPISAIYLEAIDNIQNVEIISASKWLNQVLIRTSDANAIAALNSQPFVRSTSVIAPIFFPGIFELFNKKFDERITPLPPPSRLFGTRRTNEVHDDISYGNNFDQVHIHEGEYLHNRKFRGAGIVIAVFDAGFNNVPTNPVFDSLRANGRLLGGYDFVNGTPGISLANSHGMHCLSVLAANRPGVMVGSAPDASYWLLRTENDGSEFPVEEHNWAVAAEFSDSAGVDMISSSLGYTTFSDPSFNHSYADRNGNLCMSTIAADLAAKKGIIVMNSAGNNGGQASDERYVSCPADGDSVVAVGAIRADKVIAGFSSWGPNSAGQVKPDLLSIGQGTIIANATGNPAAANGTSFSNPNLAGLFACLWQAFPEFSNMEIIDAVKRSSDRYLNPDSRYGYGIPNFRIAHQYLSEQMIRRNSELLLDNNWIKAYPVPFDSNLTVLLKAPASGKAQIRLLDVSGRMLQVHTLTVVQDELYFINLTSAPNLTAGMYFVQYVDGNTNKTIRVIKKQ